LPDGFGTYTADAAGAWTFAAGTLAGATCTPDVKSQVAELAGRLTQAAGWAWAPGAAGWPAQLSLTGAAGTLVLTQEPATLNWPVVDGTQHARETVRGQWRAESVEVLAAGWGQGPNAIPGTVGGPFLWTVEIGADYLVMPPPCANTPSVPVFYVASSGGRWAATTGMVKPAVLGAGGAGATTEPISTGVELATTWTMPDPTTLVLTGPQYRVVLTKLPLCLKPGRVLEPVTRSTLTAEVERSSIKRGAEPKIQICVRDAGLTPPVGSLTVTYSVNGSAAATEQLALTAADLGRVGVAIPAKLARKNGRFDITISYQPQGSGGAVVTRARYVPQVAAAFVKNTIKTGAKPKVKVTVSGAGVVLASGKVQVALRSLQTGKLVGTASAAIAKPARTASVTVTLPAVAKAGLYTATVTYRGSKQLASVVISPSGSESQWGPALALTVGSGS
jgi:hypothetical protein